ncbi:hypothetical protein QEN19_001708 [Hanseniaspora menglaensis]
MNQSNNIKKFNHITEGNITKKKSFIPPSVFTYQFNKRNYGKSYDEYLMKFIQDNVVDSKAQENLFPFVENYISKDINNDNDKMVDILVLYMHIYEFNLEYKKGSAKSKEMMYDESALLSLQLLLDDIIDIDVDDLIESLLVNDDSDSDDLHSISN